MTQDESYELVHTPNHLPVEIAFGCRDPRSAVGSWIGAFTFHKEHGSYGKNILSIYDNGVDYVNDQSCVSDAVEIYKLFKEQGWKPMSTSDLEKTSGIIIDQYTQINPPCPPPSSSNIYLPIMESMSATMAYKPPTPPPFMVPIIFGVFICGLIYISQPTNVT